jgi:serine/threonine-protein kinase RsbW
MKYNLKVPCSKDKLKSIREFVENTLKKYALPELEISQLVLAVDEICANMIIHSHDCDDSQSIDILIQVDKGKSIVFEITDHGHSFNYKEYQEPTLNEIVQSKKKGGIGLMLVKRIMDNVEFTTSPGHNICRLLKKL